MVLFLPLELTIVGTSKRQEPAGGSKGDTYWCLERTSVSKTTWLNFTWHTDLSGQRFPAPHTHTHTHPPPITGFSTDAVSQIKPKWKCITTDLFEQSNSQVSSPPQKESREILWVVGKGSWHVHRKLDLCPSMVKSWESRWGLGDWQLQRRKLRVAAKHVELDFLAPFLSLETLGVGGIWRGRETGMGLLDHTGASLRFYPNSLNWKYGVVASSLASVSLLVATPLWAWL